MNILLTTHVFPWPPSSGASIRTAATIRALGGLGDLDVVCIVDPARVEGRVVPSGEPVRRSRVLGRPPWLNGGIARLAWLATGSRPLKLSRDYSEVRSQFAAWARSDYDLAWLGGPEGFAAFADLIDAPIICNFDDLEDQKLTARVRLGTDDRAHHWADHWAHHWASARKSPPAQLWAGWRDRVEIRRWKNLHASIAERSAAVAVCSALDADTLTGSGFDNVAVVPNVYPEPACPAGRKEAGAPPTITFVGLLTYEPNIDAARFLVGDVLPHLRRRLGGSVALRLVGGYDERVAGLGREPGVTLTGAVPDIAAELARADVAAVPIRFGGGTRVKILEAFAHRIPVVSTPQGAEGLEVVDGEHLLIAEGAFGFAAACVEALQPAVRARVRAAAHERWTSYYRPEAMETRVAELVAKAVN